LFSSCIDGNRLQIIAAASLERGTLVSSATGDAA
jgi:hypothetical protein